MAHAIEEEPICKPICKDHLEYQCQTLAQNQAPKDLMPQVLVLPTEEAEVESSSLSKKITKIFNKIKYNAKILEEEICVNKYKEQIDARLLGVRNSTINF